MKKINIMLDNASDNILGLNSKIKFTESLQNHLDDISLFINSIINNNKILSEIENDYLTPTLIYLWKIEKLHSYLKESWINQIVLKLDFNLLNYNEFFDYYDLKVDDDWLNVDLWNSTTLFNVMYKSVNNNLVYLLNQELYEHEDDTDWCNYFIILKWK